MLPRDALVCLVKNGEIKNFASVVFRDARDLAGTHDDDFRSKIGLCIHDKSHDVSELLSYAGLGPCWQMIQVSNNFFAYEPVLRVLQKKDSIAMAHKILDPCSPGQSPVYLKDLNIEEMLPKKLNESQREALSLALSSRLALIQGPPGTGKSFVGEELIDIIYKHTNEKILIECYTNHALDQFLEGLLDRGIKGIVRIGGRSKSAKLEPLNIKNLSDNSKATSANTSVSRRRAAQLYTKRDEARSRAATLNNKLENFESTSWNDISQFLKIYYPDDYDELIVPETNDGFQLVGDDGKSVDKHYKWHKWRKGQDVPKKLKAALNVSPKANSIWNLNRNERNAKMNEWAYEINRENREELAELMVELKSLEADLKALHKVNEY